MCSSDLQNAQDALKQTQAAEILVQTSFDDAAVKLMVKDNGQGFPVDLLAHAFEPYVTTKSHGTGLGLAIVKKMVEEHFGQIKIENNATGGACITIVLPVEKSAEIKLTVLKLNNQKVTNEKSNEKLSVKKSTKKMVKTV